jgi:hypothetical protein
MRFRKTLVILGIAAAVAAAVVAGTAFAQTPTPTPSGTNYQQLFLQKLAAALNISTDQLTNAITSARNATVDQAVADGRITQQQGNNIKSRPGTLPFGFGFGRPGGNGAGRSGFVGGTQVLNAVASALGMQPQDLTNQLRSGKTLADIAGNNAQAVKDAIWNTVKPQLDQAVKNARITQDRENQIQSQIQNLDLSKITGNNPGFLGRGLMGNGNQNRVPRTRPSSGRALPGNGTL